MATTACRVTLEQSTVLALINKETSLLSPQPVNVEFQAILNSHIGVELTYQILILRVEMSLVGQCGLALVIHITDNPCRNSTRA